MHPHACANKLTNRVHGCVYDAATGEALVGAVVVLTSPGAEAATAVTDEDGEWGADAGGDDLQLTVYYGDISGELSIRVPPRSPSYQVPAIRLSTACNARGEIIINLR